MNDRLGSSVDRASPDMIPRYHQALDFEALWREFPPPPDYFSGTYRLSRDEMRAMQEQRFLRQMERAWQVPFYRRHWSAAGMEPGDIRGLDDLARIPPFSVHDMRESAGNDPPWADYIGIDPAEHAPLPLILQTSGGTTGLPRPMIFTPRDREVMNIITGRRLYMQGVRPFDLVQVALSMGLTNGGVLAREGIWKYTGAVPVMTGSGAQTPTRRQIELIKAWKAKFLIGFPAYLRHMGLVARDELKLDPRELPVKGLIVHLGTDDRAALEALWGADVYDTYGCNECGTMAAECGHKSGMHVFEDAFVLEVNDPETLQPRSEGERGVVFITTLFKYAAPMIRYNMNDVTSVAAGECACGCVHRRITKIFGRSDNMVKLRGVNVFPEAIGAIVSEDARTNGEYVCVLESAEGGRESMTVMVETADQSMPPDVIEGELADRLKEALGVRLEVQAVARGGLDHLTGLSQTSKIKRLIDRRVPHRAEAQHGQGDMDKVTKLFDCHSHWGTKRGYMFRTEAELAQQEKIWKTKATFWSEDEMADYFRQNNVRTILDLSFTKFLPIEEIRAHHDYAFEFQRKHPDVVFGHWLQFDPRRALEAIREFDRALGGRCRLRRAVRQRPGARHSSERSAAGTRSISSRSRPAARS